jgi:photosystem II stability/assembly factor-like uncharacterized protein
MRLVIHGAAALILGSFSSSLLAQRAATPPAPDTANKITSATLSGLRFRTLGPALTSGRIVDIAIHRSNKSTWYIAAASGGVWKTVNAGTTWTPIFDEQGSYSIGALAIDPKDPLTVWVGTGENNSQRSVGYGDGVYKTTDGGRTWTNTGLKLSGNIGRIAIDPRNSAVVYVAAQGPLWSGGGERGVYKTTDGGATWTQVLKGDNDWTGANEVHLDPRNPDVVYAVMWQRFRRQWGFIDGGPGSGIQKSIDGGKTWKKLTTGLPTEEMGKIGLAVSPADPSTVYAIIEAANRGGGVFRSTDAGSSWRKMSPYTAGPPFYYHRLFPDPREVERFYSIDVVMQVTADSGRTFTGLNTRRVHVDYHVMWVDPDNTSHLITGNDGGLYESHDRGATWRYSANLPLTQFYKVAVDSAKPFYNILGGTQDNNTIAGPSRTTSNRGLANADWYIVVGGDGFQPRVDPVNPDIVYGQFQHGELNRLDRKTGERVNIQPQGDANDAPLRWNWDSPLILSPHSKTRIYFAAQRLFRSDDRGDTWRAVSGDLTRNLDRNKLRMMGRVWSVDAVAKNTSTSFYGNIVSLDESYRREGLIYAGTDDGLVQVTENGGDSWRMLDRIPGVPDSTYVSDLAASRHADGTVYATFNNHKAGDFKPYVMKSLDFGRTWTSITGNLPERGSAWTIVEDPVRPDLLFVGTEFGVYVTIDGGKSWVQMKGGLPVIPIRDIAIQEREGDLVLATFGRGFYVLDDYTALRTLNADLIAGEATLLPVQEASLYFPASLDAGFQGDAFFTSPNPPVGATFTYYVGRAPQSRKQKRQEAEKAAIKKNEDITPPTWEELRAEDREESPSIVLTVTDETGNVVRRLSGPASKGFQRVTWDMRLPSATPVTAIARGDDDDLTALFGGPTGGPLVAPGSYRVQLAKRVDGVLTPLGTPQTFAAAPLAEPTLGAPDRAARLAFQQRVAKLQRAVLGSAQALTEATTRLAILKQAVDQAPGADSALRNEIVAVEDKARALQNELTGDRVVATRSEPTAPGIQDRVGNIVQGSWSYSGAPTATNRRDYDIAAQQFGGWLDRLRQLVETDFKRLGDRAEAAGVAWTPGRVPVWTP